MNDRFEELRTFVTIVDAGGVNAAASKLGIARSAASRRLSDLEARLGSTLVDRTTRRFELTDTGRTLLERSRRLLTELDAIERSLRPSGEHDAELSVAADPLISARLLAEAIASFQRSHPKVRLRILSDTGDGEAQVAIRVADEAGGRALSSFRTVLVATPAYLAEYGEPSTPADLGVHKGVVATVPGQGANWTFKSGGGAMPEIAAEVSDAALALSLAIAGAGLAQLPSYLTDDAVAAGALRVVMTAHEPPTREVRAFQGERRSPLSDRFVDHVASHLGNVAQREV